MTRSLTAAAIAALATFATFSTTSTAHAATATVQTADLDLSTAAGQAKLEARLDRAARAVCSDTVTGSRLAVVDPACVSQARAAIEKTLASRRMASKTGG